jgi:shikimate kinase
MIKNHIIYIIGFMGSGKTTAGKNLASTLGWSFVDLDKKIELHTGKTIPEIFAQNGESYFREQESFLLRTLKTASDTIISTGGGTPCYGDNMDFMLENGLTLYLKMKPEELMNRLSASNSDRPLIKDLNRRELRFFIEEKLAVREKFYDRSDLVADGSDPDIKEICTLVKEMLKI